MTINVKVTGIAKYIQPDIGVAMRNRGVGTGAPPYTIEVEIEIDGGGFAEPYKVPVKLGGASSKREIELVGAALAYGVAHAIDDWCSRPTDISRFGSPRIHVGPDGSQATFSIKIQETNVQLRMDVVDKIDDISAKASSLLKQVATEVRHAVEPLWQQSDQDQIKTWATEVINYRRWANDPRSFLKLGLQALSHAK